MKASDEGADVEKNRNSYLFSKRTRGQDDEDGFGDEWFQTEAWPVAQLSEPTDFSKYMERIADGTATERHHEEFALRMILRFCENAESASVEPVVLRYLAEQLFKVAMGGRWEDELPLPWAKMSLPWTRAEWDALQIYCFVSSTHSADSSQPITKAIEKAAAHFSCSYEKARAAYYDLRHLCPDPSKSEGDS
ncbi:hypothetical protein [Uliginosibacterium sp. H1]|uniref:hypothetical protein n=1 Tax=Uliginosibacterium sp. H1 TaxID=3114757 RepID=UPI002E16BEAA|nr:hypothetical protein [Uliginosibacterium sp. H1]